MKNFAFILINEILYICKLGQNQQIQIGCRILKLIYKRWIFKKELSVERMNAMKSTSLNCYFIGKCVKLISGSIILRHNIKKINEVFKIYYLYTTPFSSIKRFYRKKFKP